MFGCVFSVEKCRVKKKTHHGPVQGLEGEMTSLVAARRQDYLVQIPSQSVGG